MPMPRSPEPTVVISMRLPESLVLEVRALLADPSTGFVRYGSMSRTWETLLRDWLSAQKVSSG